MKKVIAILSICVIVLCVFAACGSSSKDAFPLENGNYQYAAQDTANEGMVEAYTQTSEVTDAKVTSEVNVSDTRKLIKTVSLSVETKEFDAYVAGVREAIAAAGGYTEAYTASSNGYYDGFNRSADLTARIPADKLDSFVESAGKYGKIVSRSEQVSDVTLDYVDTESRIKALKTERDSLTELLTKAGSLENIIAIQTRLSEVNYEIESYESQLRVLQNQVSYSTVSISICEVERVTAVDESLGQQIKTRLLNNLSAIREDAKNFAVNFIGGLPYIIIWAVVIVIALLIARKVYKKRKSKKAKADVPPAA